MITNKKWGTYSNSTLSTSGTVSVWSNWTLPTVVKVLPQTISQSIVSVKPMSATSGIFPSGIFNYYDFYYHYKIKYVENIFVEISNKEEKENVFVLKIPSLYDIKEIIKIMNENRCTEKIKELIEDDVLRKDIINILRIVKIKMLLNK